MVGDQAPEAKLWVRRLDEKERVCELVCHDMPFVDERDECLDVEFDFGGSRGKTHGDGIIRPSLLHKLTSQ